MASASPATLRSRYRALALVGVLVMMPLASALSISFAVTPEEIESGAVVVAPECHIKRVFGRPCPTCGLTRAFAALSHGRVDEAARYNRAALLVYALYWLGALGAGAVALRSTIRYLALAPHRTTPSPPEIFQ